MKVDNWKSELSEYGALHNEDCCVNFEGSRACDVGTLDDDCCENIRLAAAFVREHSKALIEYLSHDMKFKDEEQRKSAIKLYCENFDFNKGKEMR